MNISGSWGRWLVGAEHTGCWLEPPLVPMLNLSGSCLRIPHEQDHWPSVTWPRFPTCLPFLLVLRLLSFFFPSTLGSGILQLLQSRTSRKFLACRLTPDMETKLLFMTSRVS